MRLPLSRSIPSQDGDDGSRAVGGPPAPLLALRSLSRSSISLARSRAFGAAAPPLFSAPQRDMSAPFVSPRIAMLACVPPRLAQPHPQLCLSHPQLLLWLPQSHLGPQSHLRSQHRLCEPQRYMSASTSVRSPASAVPGKYWHRGPVPVSVTPRRAGSALSSGSVVAPVCAEDCVSVEGYEAAQLKLYLSASTSAPCTAWSPCGSPTVIVGSSQRR